MGWSPGGVKYGAFSAVNISSIGLENGLRAAPLLRVKLSSGEKGKFAHFSVAMSGLIVCFCIGAIRIFIYLGNYRESFTPRGNYAELSDSLSRPTACVSLVIYPSR